MNYWIWYATLETLTPNQKYKLLMQFGSPERICNAKINDLIKLNFLDLLNIAELSASPNIDLISKYEIYMKKNNIHMINLTDREYPQNLKNIYDPPISIFVKGNVNLLKGPSIAIVGCRKASQYGLNVAKKMSYELALRNIVIVSGMAKGIDGMAHEGALLAYANTIAVLGSGVDYPYPLENVEIYKKILQNGGLIISEYIVGVKPSASHFPQRNRIISALSNGVLVVEAMKKSGTMITVDFALEQGKNVYVIPGNIDSPNSFGTNELIKQGAKLVSNIEDILEDY